MLAGRRALVIGLAREGVDLTRFLTAHGASVVVSDQKSADQLRAAVGQVGDGDVTLKLGGHDSSHLDGIDVVYASPGVPPEHPLLQAARNKNIQLSSLVELFFALWPRPVLANPGRAGQGTRA